MRKGQDLQFISEGMTKVRALNGLVNNTFDSCFRPTQKKLTVGIRFTHENQDASPGRENKAIQPLFFQDPAAVCNLHIIPTDTHPREKSKWS